MNDPVLLHVASHAPLAYKAIESLSSVAPNEILAMATAAEVLETVEHTPGCAGVLAIEDSYGGEDTAVLDRLIFGTSQVFVSDEVVVGETLGAFRIAGAERSEARFVLSEPRAVEHCRSFIQQNGLRTTFVGSTFEACKQVAESADPSLVALATADVAEPFGLRPVATSVGDIPEARTRFVVISRAVGLPTGDDKTTLVLTQPDDASGNLQRFLQAFTKHEVNLTSLHSRPLASAAEFCFLVTAEGHIGSAPLHNALRELWEAGAQIKLVGSFPRWRGDEVVAPFGEPPASVGRQSSDLARRALLIDFETLNASV